MNLTLKVWRQKNASDAGQLVTYEAKDVSPDMSFLEMLDVVNEELSSKNEEPIAFDHDCREGICGMCSLVINGKPHGPQDACTTCQLHMRSFKDGDTIMIEPWRAKAFPVIKDLVVDRTSFDRIIQSGGYISVPTGAAADALCGIHCLIGINLGDEDGICVRRSAGRNRNIAAGLDDTVEAGTIYD